MLAGWGSAGLLGVMGVGGSPDGSDLWRPGSAADPNEGFADSPLDMVDCGIVGSFVDSFDSSP